MISKVMQMCRIDFSNCLNVWKRAKKMALMVNISKNILEMKLLNGCYGDFLLPRLRSLLHIS